MTSLMCVKKMTQAIGFSMVEQFQEELELQVDDIEALVDDPEEGVMVDEADFDPEDGEELLEDVRKKKKRLLENDGNETMHCPHCNKSVKKRAFESHCAR